MAKEERVCQCRNPLTRILLVVIIHHWLLTLLSICSQVNFHSFKKRKKKAPSCFVSFIARGLIEKYLVFVNSWSLLLLIMELALSFFFGLPGDLKTMKHVLHSWGSFWERRPVSNSATLLLLLYLDLRIHILHRPIHLLAHSACQLSRSKGHLLRC